MYVNFIFEIDKKLDDSKIFIFFLSCPYAETKAQISFAVAAKLISAFVFATRIVQSHFFLNTKLQDSNHFLYLYSPVCVRSGQKSRRPVFSQQGSFYDSGFTVCQDGFTHLEPNRIVRWAENWRFSRKKTI